MTSPAPAWTPETLCQAIADRVTVDPSGCWLVGRPGAEGYPMFTLGPRRVRLHRLVNALTAGPIPDGYVVDHQCHNDDTSCPGGVRCWHRRCVNPEHLRAVPPRVNTVAAVHGNDLGPRRGWIATQDLAVQLGHVTSDAPTADRTEAARALGRQLAAHGLRTVQVRRADGLRCRGYYLDDLREHAPELLS